MVVGMEEKALLAVAAQKRMRTDISVVRIGRANKEDYVCELGRIYKPMLSKHVATSGRTKPPEIHSAVERDFFVGRSQHVNAGHNPLPLAYAVTPN
jgi:hypothetical protein